MALQSYWKFQIAIEFLEDLADQLRTSVTSKNRNAFNLYLEAKEVPNSKLLRPNPPLTTTPLKDVIVVVGTYGKNKGNARYGQVR